MAVVTIVIVSLFFAISETALVIKPSDVVAIDRTSTNFRCGTNLTDSSIHWVHTPVGSNESVEFYYNGFLQTADFYKTNLFISKSSDERSVFLMIDIVTTRHAGKYECYDDSGDSASAKLGVIDRFPECAYVNNFDLTETEITCNASMIGELEPEMICYRDSLHPYSGSRFGRYDDATHAKIYFSVKVPLSKNTDRTNFRCLIHANREVAHVGMYVTVYHERSTSTIETTSLGISTIGDVDPSDEKTAPWINEYGLYIFISVPVLVAIILTCLLAAMYLRSRRVAAIKIRPRDGADIALV